MNTPSTNGLHKIKKRIGELLVEEGLVKQEDVEAALTLQQEEGGKRIVGIMIDAGTLNADAFENFMVGQSNTTPLGLPNYQMDPDVYGLIPEAFAIKKEVFPVDKMGRMLTLGMVYPLDQETIDEVSEMTGLSISPFLCSFADIEYAHERYYRAVRH